MSAAVLIWALAQNAMAPAGMQISAGTGALVLGGSYLYADYWLWLLHCFLDRKENLQSRIPIVQELAKEFQDHHDTPKEVLYGNHCGFMDGIIGGVAGMALLTGAWTSPAAKLMALGVIVFGRLGGLNHFYGHAITHKYEVPAFYKNGQELGLLPSAQHHRIHHTDPHEENWNFLNGLHSIVYEPLYYATNKPYLGLGAMFYLLNPVILQVWLLAAGISSTH
eukprot:gnl/TRDRNA2_/TRDRNA2_184733_c0_seq1.p1 gnl/TRDRNA2_/TRDRNA2_184733_c0~~gnl/TRDRNA2_/TRDRNA2_184733_c0_seq1.p1  ORF type:complete len:254 (-),score=28.18 gnl/TRDRNA2_/TRDRNA2_184733_c0_seq1:366-1031(-)